MSLTVMVNPGDVGLTLCHRGSNGISSADLPDICNTPTPPTPVSYPNIASSRDLTKGSTTVSADGGMMCANFGSEFAVSTGDEAGCAGGVKSATFAREASWITYSFNVKIEGSGACRLSDKMLHNACNTANTSGEIQRPLQRAKHQCHIRTGNWTEGPKFNFEEFPLTGYDFRQIPPTFEGTFYHCFSFRLKGKFIGAVECTCTECGAKSTIKWESKTLVKEFSVCKPIDPITTVMSGRAKAALYAYKLFRGILTLDKAIQEFGPLILPTINAIERALGTMASLVCEGQTLAEQVQALFDAAFRPPLPPDAA